MRILIETPSIERVRTGNRQTATAWSGFFAELGASTTTSRDEADLLVAMHAWKNADVIDWFRAHRPEVPVVLVLTGTDLYPEPNARALASMRAADRIVVLQARARDRVPAELRDRVRVIVQSARPVPGDASREGFDICVLGHLRAIKDPMRAAEASRLLPDTSRIRIRHAGAILEPAFEERVAREQEENPRYTWLGELDADGLAQLLLTSQLQVLSSAHEGGGRVIGDSVVAGTPLLAARNDATLSLLGAHYAGLYDVGDTKALAALMERAETDPAFLPQLCEQTRACVPQFDAAREREALRALLEELR
ncbi:MAG: glycosyltransferase [Planctomycetota bacterium]